MAVGAADIASDSGPSNGASILRLVLGALLLFAAARKWRKRPGPGEESAVPGCMSAIDAFKPVKAPGAALLLSEISPKNLSLTLAANNATVTFVLLLIFGAVLTGKGISGLA